MRLPHEVVDDLDRRAETHAIALPGRVLEERPGGNRGTLHDLPDRFIQAGLGLVLAFWTGLRPNLAIPPPPRSPDERRRLFPPVVHAVAREREFGRLAYG